MTVVQKTIPTRSNVAGLTKSGGICLSDRETPGMADLGQLGRNKISAGTGDVCHPETFTAVFPGLK